MPKQAPSIVFANYKPAFGWFLTSCCLLMAAVISFIFYKDGPPAGFSPLSFRIMLFLFWSFVVGGATYAFNIPCVIIFFTPEARLRVVMQYPFSKQTNEVSPSSIKQVTIVETKDSDGDPYFLSRVNIDNGMRFDFYESHHRPDCEMQCEKMRALLKQTRPTN